jgi:sensor c-di-GMP phosphodiesterase-like protein
LGFSRLRELRGGVLDCKRGKIRPVASPKLWKLAAIPLGLALAGVPAAGVHTWLSHYIEQDGLNELDISARRVIALTEMRLAGVIRGLDELAAAGVRACAGSDRDAMNEMSFRIVPVKEVSIVDSDGRTICTNLALPSVQRQVVSSPIESTHSEVVIEIIRLGEGTENGLRIRRSIADGAWLAALIPSDLLIPRISPNGGPVAVTATLCALDGTIIGERSVPHPDSTGPPSLLTTRSRSEHFGIVVSTSIPRARVLASHADLMTMATVGTGSAATLMLALVVLGSRRSRANPADEMAHAIDKGEFIPYYQPIVDLKTARVVSAEVLIRWRKPNGELVAPAQFIPLAEASGLIVPLTRVLMRRVCAEAGGTIGARPHFKIGFNLSARHFVDEAIVKDVKAIFGRSPIALHQLLLEVTERQPLENLTLARRVIAALQGLGVHIGLDDVGTGHSGLSYILKLGIDFIKIDKLFVDSIDTERYSTTIIETLVGLGRDMRMDIIAEGVETFEQVQQLRARGIRKAQGYVFAPPLPGPSFLKLLEAADPKPARNVAANAKRGAESLMPQAALARA